MSIRAGARRGHAQRKVYGGEYHSGQASERSLSAEVLKWDTAWMDRVAHRTVDFEKAGKQTNNHHYWRGLAATVTGIVCSDTDLFRWGTARVQARN